MMKKGGSPSSFFSYKRLNLHVRVFLTRCIVAEATGCVKKITATCLPMTGYFYDTVILASLVKQW